MLHLVLDAPVPLPPRQYDLTQSMQAERPVRWCSILALTSNLDNVSRQRYVLSSRDLGCFLMHLVA